MDIYELSRDEKTRTQHIKSRCTGANIIDSLFHNKGSVGATCAGFGSGQFLRAHVPCGTRACMHVFASCACAHVCNLCLMKASWYIVWNDEMLHILHRSIRSFLPGKFPSHELQVFHCRCSFTCQLLNEPTDNCCAVVTHPMANPLFDSSCVAHAMSNSKQVQDQNTKKCRVDRAYIYIVSFNILTTAS